MLSKSQQEIIENSLWVVNTALKKQGLENNDDLRQDAILYLCQCLTRFDPLKGVKWSTYAYRNIFLYVKRKNAEEMAFRNQCVDIDEMKDVLVGEYAHDDSDMSFGNYLLSKMNEIEKKIFNLMVEGYKIPEIVKETKLRLDRVKEIISNVQERYSSIILEEEYNQGDSDMIILTQKEKEQIRLRKNKGEPNSKIMKDYRLTYAELRNILDDGVKEQYVEEER